MDEPSEGAAAAEGDADVRELADTVPHMMWISAPRGGVTFFNRRFYEYTGQPEPANGMAWKAVVHPDDLPGCVASRDEAIRTASPWRHEYRLRGRDGDYRWHLGRTLPLFDAEGTVRRWVGTATDIHEEVEQRTALQATAEALRTALERVAEAADRQRRFLREVLSSVTEGRLLLCDAPDELPPPPPKARPALPLFRETLGAFRQEVRAVSAQAGLDAGRAGDLLVAAGEAAMNAVVHGRGGEGVVDADPESGTVRVWVRDQGDGIAEDSLHRATLERGYSSAGTLGHGFHLILRSCDRVFLLTGDSGTTVVLEQDARIPADAP